MTESNNPGPGMSQILIKAQRISTTQHHVYRRLVISGPLSWTDCKLAYCPSPGVHHTGFWNIMPNTKLLMR
jgi:hypothetical protein